MEGTHASVTLAVALAAGVVAQSAARHLRLPGIVLLLAAGALIGPQVLGWVEPHSLGAALFGIVDFGVAVILFEGGLNLEIGRLRRLERSIRRLVTIGALITLGGAAVCAHYLLNWPWDLSFLFGSLVVVTGPTVVAPLVRDLRLNNRIRTVLEAEGVLIDPIGAILAVLVLEMVLVPDAASLTRPFTDVLARLGVGLAGGVVGGVLMAFLLRRRSLVPKGFENIFTLASVILLFHGCDLIIPQSGVLAVPLAGVVVGNMATPVDRDLREFKDQLTILLVGLLFILLAADVSLADVRNLGWRGFAVVGALVLVVRPLCVFLCTIKSKLNVRERVFVAWIAPRGIVAAAIASLVAAAMETQQMAGAADLRALVFLTIAGTVLLAGLTARPVATLLGVRLPGRDRVAILGAHGLGLALGARLKEARVPVVFIDADPRRCQQAQEAGFAVVFGDGLQERTMLRAQVELVGTAIGGTPNAHLNTLFVNQAREMFGVPRCCVVVDAMAGEKAPPHVERHETEVLFDGPHDAERWDVRWRHGEVLTATFVYEAKPENDQDDKETKPIRPSRTAKVAERFVMLAVLRDDRVRLMTVGFKPRQGDQVTVALYKPEHEEALKLLAQMGWHQLLDDGQEHREQ